MQGAPGERRELAEVRHHTQAFAFMSVPLDTLILIRHSRSAPRSHSLDWNNIGVKGASALAAILKETQITKLRCAAL